MEFFIFGNTRSQNNKFRPDGGIGRHAGLKILFAEKASAGSIPAPGTDPSLNEKGFLFRHYLLC